jgi:hypothetical protein
MEETLSVFFDMTRENQGNNMPTDDNGRKELEDIKSLLRNNIELLKPVFGMMFWELADAEQVMNADEFLNHGMSLNLEEIDDEIIAAFMATYAKLWQNSNDYTAASRFIANCLSMSADELLQCRHLYLERKKQP